MKLTKIEWGVSWICQIFAAIIMLQTLYFKFSGSEESVYIFSTLNMEPWGRYGSGVAELIASVLLLMPKTTYLGAVLGLGIMGGAIMSHLFVLGISVKDDHGQLFAYALITFACCAILAYQNRAKLLGMLGWNKF